MRVESWGKRVSYTVGVQAPAVMMRREQGSWVVCVESVEEAMVIEVGLFSEEREMETGLAPPW